jgi:hypothetical protein
VLRRLYSLGLPLISVICVDYGSEDSRNPSTTTPEKESPLRNLSSP